MDRLQHINRTLSSHLGRLRSIQNAVDETENLADQARARVDDTKKLIETASHMLDRAKIAVANVVGSLGILFGNCPSSELIREFCFLFVFILKSNLVVVMVGKIIWAPEVRLRFVPLHN